MKKTINIILLILLTTTAKAQRCSVCGGDGMVGYLVCFSCGGAGTMQGQYQVMQNMKDAGAKAFNVLTGKYAIIEGNYKEALNLFTKILEDEEKSGKTVFSGEVTFFIGAMIELGMGVSNNQDLAYKFYNLGSQLGNRDCYYSIQRIKKEGYYDATEEMRREFRTLLKINVEAQYNNNINIQPNNNTPSNHSSRKHNCNSCGGTGKCTSCNGKGWHTVDLIYTSGEKVTNCPICNGSGKCKVCYGNGSFY